MSERVLGRDFRARADRGKLSAHLGLPRTQRPMASGMGPVVVPLSNHSIYTSKELMSEPAMPERTRFEPAPGVMIAERYRIEELLGEGAMGSVWRATHIDLDKPVAVKVLKEDLRDEDQACRRFLREAKSAAALRSPHVAEIFDYGVEKNTPFLAMELLTGETLAARLESSGPMTLEDLKQVLLPVFLVVEKAHGLGIVHRDLKPENFFLAQVDGREVVKVLDFGIAKRLDTPGLDRSTLAGSIVGTPQYMSPEQLTDAAHVDTRADLWALGVIAYEILVGELPFGGKNVAALAISVMTEAAPTPSRKASLPVAFDRWFGRATDRSIALRFQSARDMANQLLEVSSEQPVSRTGGKQLLWPVVAPLAIALLGASYLVIAPSAERGTALAPSTTAVTVGRESESLRVVNVATTSEQANESRLPQTPDAGTRVHSATSGELAEVKQTIKKKPSKRKRRGKRISEAKGKRDSRKQPPDTKRFDVDELEF